jgi:dTDP-4-amino-4,6-dideoxygalactose transaminase
MTMVISPFQILEPRATMLMVSMLDKKNLKVLRKIVVSSLKQNLYEFDPKKPSLPLMVPQYSSEEVLEAIDTLLTTNVTMGEKVFKFEEKFASYIGSKNGIMVNSGSSANLVAFSVLSNPMTDRRTESGFEAIIPAVTWSTTMFPIATARGVPVLCDIDGETFALSPEAASRGKSDKTRLVVPVHLLGNPCDVEAIKSVAGEDIWVVEDSCEAHGAEISGKKVGSFGDLSTFSFYFSHHISTIEGGMVITNNEELAEISRMLRAHGWIRELKRKDEFAKKYPSIDRRFLFVNEGFNLRPTEIQGAFGIHQIKKLESFIQSRRANALYLEKRLRKYNSYIELQTERPGTRHVWFGYPITVNGNAPFSKDDLASFLENRGIQTRPIMAGNLAEQPATALLEHRIVNPLSNSERVKRHSFFIGNHQYLGKDALNYIVSCFEEFFTKRS